MLEIPDDVYEELTRTAKSTGKPIAELIRERVREHQEPSDRATLNEKQAGLQRLMQFAGAIDSGDPHSADNERIDADLQREYRSTDKD
jgi:hypothetical protein